MMEQDGHESGPQALSARDMPRGASAREVLEGYWRSMRRDGALPRRRDLDPSGMEAALPHAFVLELVAPGVARMRVAGQAIAGHAGGEARGMPLSVLFDAGSRSALALWLDRCVGRPGVVELAVESQGGALRAASAGRLLLLPLLDAEGQVTRALGGLFLDQPARRVRAPFRLLDVAPARWEPLPQAAPARLALVAGEGGAGGGTTGRPRLRLVVDNAR